MITIVFYDDNMTFRTEYQVMGPLLRLPRYYMVNGKLYRQIKDFFNNPTNRYTRELYTTLDT